MHIQPAKLLLFVHICNTIRATAPNINVIVLCGFRVPFAPFLRTD